MAEERLTNGWSEGPDPDAALMLQVRDGRPEAFQALVDRYYKRVVRLLAHLVGRPDEAEDLAQEVFLRVYRARGRYEPSAKFSTWLFTVANRLAMNAMRRRKRRPDVQLVLHDSSGLVLSPEALVLASDDPGPDSHLASSEISRLLWRASAM